MSRKPLTRNIVKRQKSQKTKQQQQRVAVQLAMFLTRMHQNVGGVHWRALAFTGVH
jgi:hypothetical protein